MTVPENTSLLKFPCLFPIKMMGRDDDNFRRAALAIVAEHAGDVAEDAIKIAPSSAGNFVSVTVTITAQNQDQLDAIYRALSSHEDVLVAL